METQNILDSQSNLEKKKSGAGGINLPDFRLYYKFSHQDSMVPAQKQKCRPMEQDRKPREKPTHLWAAYL